MHEMGIVQSIMEIVEQQARIHGARRVVRISLEFGFLTAVQPDAIRFAFDVLSKGGIADSADLDITIIPIKVGCQQCTTETVIHDYSPYCPVCGSPSVQIVEGRDEMRIASLEIEDHDTPSQDP
jgi:hydrogenase nickel incorporation protein HypA/HybF